MALPENFDLLGNGWDTVENDHRNKVLSVTHNELAATNECNIYKCENTQDIINYLDIGASASVQHAFAAVEAKASFIKECSKKYNSLTLLVKVKRTWKAIIESAAFKKDDDVHSIIQNANKLQKYAGDSYLSFVEVGTEYYAAYQFNVFDSIERETISASIDAQLKGPLKIGVDASAKIENIVKNTGSKLSFTQKLVGSSLGLPDMDNIIKFALDLTSSQIPNPELLSYGTTRYSTLPDAPSGLSYIEKRISTYVYPQSGWYPYSIKAIEQQAKLVLSRTQAVATLYKFYNAQEELQKKLSDHCAGCSQIIDIINAWKLDLIPRSNIGKVDEHPKKPEINLEFLKVPQSQFVRTFGKKWGRQEGGSPWSDFDDEMVYSFGYPKTFRCKGGLVLDSLTTVYGYRNPEDPTNPGNETLRTKSHGGDGGIDLEFSYSFSPDEIRSIGLCSKSEKVPGESDQDFNRYVGLICGFQVFRRGINENLNMGRRDGPWVANDVPHGCSFLGFQGRSKEQIDCLQPVYVEFKDPTWLPFQPKA